MSVCLVGRSLIKARDKIVSKKCPSYSALATKLRKRYPSFENRSSNVTVRTIIQNSIHSSFTTSLDCTSYTRL
ncbi:MAG: hypothetical protein JGK28_20090 [Microcoleus sp. PH2017_07_MST_O_A]|nr:hypothetical protein [Microcoleus sp. PH2017_07_MST_O_A]